MERKLYFPRIKLCGILFFAFFTFTANWLFAQTTISGRIADNNGNGVPGATIQIKNTTTGTTSANDGRYSLTANLKSGQQVVQFSAIGFKTQERTLPGDGRNAYTFDITFTEDVSG